MSDIEETTASEGWKIAMDVHNAVEGKDEAYSIIALISQLTLMLNHVKDDNDKVGYLLMIVQCLERCGLIEGMDRLLNSSPKNIH